MAKITTITNPLTGQPAQVDQLDHTAQQIDDGISRALPGGAIDIALQNKAPAGYGLGASSKNVTDWNNEKTNGWVRDPSGTEDKHSPFVGLFSVGLVSDYAAGGDAFQLAFARNQSAKTRTYIKYRAYNSDDKVWGEWEWVNPPMELDKEYRTTERYLGKPVYCITKFVGEVTADTLTQVIFTRSDIGGYCIRAFCTGKRTFSNWEDSATSMVSSPAGSETIITCDPTVYRLNEGYRGIRAQIKSSSNLKDVYCTAYYTKWAD